MTALMNYHEHLKVCIGQLLTDREYQYQAESNDELVAILEAVSLQMEDYSMEFTFSIEGTTVRFQLV